MVKRALTLAVGLLLIPAASAAATPCTDLQTQINTAPAGSTISIATTITGCSLMIPGTASPLTLKGTTASAGFSGDGGVPVISGNDPGTLTIQNLRFTSAPDGGMDLNGKMTLTISGSTFLDDGTPTGTIGAVYLNTQSGGPITISGSTFGAQGHGNQDGVAGGAALDIFIDASRTVNVANNQFAYNATASFGGGFQLQGTAGGFLTLTGNRFTGNVAAEAGGGADLVTGKARLTGNVFQANSVHNTSAPPPGVAGGGLNLLTGYGATQVGNAFVGNSVRVDHQAGSTTDNFGGGEVASGSVDSFRDSFVSNTLVGVTGAAGSESEGGGFAASPCGIEHAIRLRDAVVAANSVGAGGEGDGVYVGCVHTPVQATIADSSIVGNHGDAGIAGGSQDTLAMSNSIDTGSPSGLSGFATRALAFNDACVTGSSGAAVPGSHDFCANPKLRSATNLHETNASPTRDRGSNALVPDDVAVDFDRQLRIQGPAVDVGADEFQTSVPAVQTGSATASATGTLILHGKVNPNGEVTRYWFEVGRSRRYGLSTVGGSLRAGLLLVRVNGRLTGLKPGLYHYVLFADNARGVLHGVDRTVTIPRRRR